MTRKKALEGHIRASYRLIREYEEQLRLSADPKEKARARRAVDEQWALIQEHLDEYLPLCRSLGMQPPPDITEIAASLEARQEGTPPQPPSPADRGVVIQGNVQGSIIVTGDGNVVRATSPPPPQVPSGEGPASIRHALLRIYDPDGRSAVGAGFLAGPQVALTCAHVLEAALTPGDTAQVDFPLLAPGHPLTARPLRRDAEADIAVLELEDPPAGARPLSLQPVAAEDLWGHPFRAFGFPAGHPDGVWAAGEIRGPNARGWLQIEDLKTTGYFVQPGFSGSPIWDEEMNGVMGMVVTAERDPGIRAAFIIPTDLLRQVWPEMADRPPDTPPPPNPFCDRGRIIDPARLFDRQHILRELRHLLAAGNSVSLVGESEIGKSSVLYALYRTAAEWSPEGVVHYVDLQNVLDVEDFCTEVLEGMGQEGSDLRALKRALRRMRVVLLLDEVEKLTHPAFTQDLHDLLRGLAQETTLTLAVASHRPLWKIFPPSSDTSPFHNIFITKRLGPFSPEDAHAFLRHRLRGTGVTFTPEEVDRLVAESGGHPAHLQRLAYDLFEQKRR